MRLLLYEKDTKNKTKELDRLHVAMKEESITSSNTEKLEILTWFLILGHKSIVLNTLGFQII